ncbi:GNAT family N-acetyltransferase [Nocardioides aquiterrae]|uniref:Bifunctional GNAT family N-acetyltransferase/acetate--CoA ligase family protein n=1 Tax=Nocardioides aquiterrae TaxID=203799 RepID=A0ABN1UHS3_9ACTN
MTPATGRPADVLLRDGSVASIRPARRTDAPALAALHDRIGPDSLRLRFFSASRVAAQAYVEHLGRSPDVLVLVAERDGGLVALATAEPVDPTTSEVSFLVDDACHGLGLGSLLLEHLAAAARERGIHRFVAEVLSENRPMIDVLTDAGFAIVRHTEAGCVHVEMDTGVSRQALRSADERERRAEASSLRPLLYPRSVAVVGARRDGTGTGAAVLRSIEAGGFTGRTWVVQPGTEVPTVRDLPEPVDLLVVAVPAVAVVGVLEDAAAAGVRAVAVLSSGFSELGRRGARLEDAMLRIARRHSMRLVGPNCLGLLSNHPDVRLDATFSGVLPPTGGLAIGSQSGGVGIVVEDAARRLGLGVLALVSLGNKLDVSSNDLLAAWYDDDRVSAAALYLESFGNARKFARVAREFSEVKPLLAVVGGHSAGGRRAGASHTAAAATPGVGVRALFAQAGVIACDGAEDLAETALFLAEQPLPAGLRVGVLSNAGGLGVLAADVAETQGLTVPELSARLRRRLARYVSGTAGTGNPVDAGAAAEPAHFAALADLLLGGGEVDALLVLLVRTAVGDAGAVAATLPEVRRRHPELPVVLVPYGGPSLPELPGLTRLGSAESALRAIGRAARYAAWRSEPPEPEVPSDRGCGEQARARALAELADRPDGGWLDTDGVVELLGAHDLAPVGAVARGADAVVEAARATGYPVVLKVAAGAVVHRTERALVRVGVSDDDAVHEVVREFEAAVADGVPVLVQPVATGIEVALGLVRDPVLGPLAMVAAGGVNTDVWDDRVFLLPPIGTRDAARAVRSLRVAALLAGHRGAAAADVDALVALVVQLGCLAEEVPEIAELDLNPVLVGPAGCTVVDAKVRIAPGPVLDAGVPRRLRGRP